MRRPAPPRPVGRSSALRAEVRTLALALALALAFAGCRQEAVILELGGEALDACELAVIAQSDALAVDLVEQSRWPSGACYELTLTNDGDRRLEWAIVVAITGALDSSWNTTVTASDDGLLEARGIDASNNLSLEPGAGAAIGFCLAC